MSTKNHLCTNTQLFARLHPTYKKNEDCCFLLYIFKNDHAMVK